MGKILPTKFIYKELYRNSKNIIPKVSQGFWTHWGASLELVWYKNKQLIKKIFYTKPQNQLMYELYRIGNIIYEKEYYYSGMIKLEELSDYTTHKIISKQYYDTGGNKITEEEYMKNR
jgi:hypothetical protein